MHPRRILVLVIGVLGCTDHQPTPSSPGGRIEIASGNQQRGDPGHPLALPIGVTVRDAAGAPARGVEVTWIADDGGSIDPSHGVTDAAGSAAASWTLGGGFALHHARAVAQGYVRADFVASARLDNELPLDVIVPVAFTTYDGSGQTVHPDHVATSGEWPGADQYLFLTPYPNGNATFENPSIFEGASPLRWTVPVETSNPIQRPAEGYYSDPDAVFVAERGELWLYYRQVTNENFIRLTKSADAIHWSTPVAVAHAPNHQLISPTVVRRAATEWLMWSVNGGDGCAAATAKVELRRSMNGVDWSAPEAVDIPQPGSFPWHIDVQWIPSRNEYWAMYNVKSSGSCTTGAVYLATSPDGVHWKPYPSPVLARDISPELRDVVYRSTFAYDDVADEITIWYSGARFENSKYVWACAVQRRRRADVFADIGVPIRASVPASRALPPLINFP